MLNTIEKSMKCIAVTSPDINNGLGCRVTLWVAGCSHHCPGCHNPETWDYTRGKSLDDFKGQIFSWLEKPYIKGLTLSGGDPIDQDKASLIELKNFLQEMRNKFPAKDIWLYTGYYLKDICEDADKMNVVNLCDVLVDGPFVKKKKDLSLPFRGSTNQNIIKIHED
jgi:anaerobic ribonucleoside-triphosphate reductase activating protein